MRQPLRSHRFIVPPIEGPVTGGTLFNRELIRALRELGEDVEVTSFAPPMAPPASGVHTWVDSLFLDDLPLIIGARRSGKSTGLIVHFLPSLLEHPTLTRAQLTARERSALDAADRFLVTSGNMAVLVRNLSGAMRPVFVVEPGRFATGCAPLPAASDSLRAIIVANVVPNKGILPFLQSLGERAQVRDSFKLQIAGHRGLAPGYADECARLVAATPQLDRRVEFLGEQSPTRIVELLQQCHVLVSASVMESYGMALAEARTLGIPLLAVDGGNVASWISPHSGGELARTHAELARAFLGICREGGVVERAEAARRTAIAPRSWHAAASEYLRLVNA